MTDETAGAKRGGPLRSLYAWVMKHAAGPNRYWALAGVSFAEASFFPIPPDLFLVPMVLADRKRTLMLTLACTVGSVIGGVFGYAIGSFLYNSLGRWLIDLYGYGSDIDAFRAAYAQWGAWIILIKGMTPIPYKLVTIASGFAGYNFAAFVALSIVTRGMRFAIVAGLLYWFGEPVRAFIEKRLEWVLLGVLVVVVLGFLSVRYL
jgi:membrane protein YqaA with SNARE-associated domain